MAQYPWRAPPPGAPSGRAPPAAGGRTAARGGQPGSARGTLHLDREGQVGVFICDIDTVSESTF